MGLSPRKWEVARDLAALLMHLALDAGARPQLFIAQNRWRELPLRQWERELLALEPAGNLGFEAPPPALLAGGERLLISDGLCPSGAVEVSNKLTRQAASSALLEILTEAELSPKPQGSIELIDLEGPRQEMLLDASACAAYQRRLAAHRQSWVSALAGRGPGVIALRAESPWPKQLQDLIAAGLVEPRR